METVQNDGRSYRDDVSGTVTATSRTDTCDRCERDTAHTVRIEIRTESRKGEENAEFSREPYRVVTCPRCGTERAQRMNNA